MPAPTDPTDARLAYQAELRRLRAEREALRAGHDTSAGRRLTLSQIVEILLQRSPRDHSSVSLTRNAKGETQIEVVVRTGDAGELLTVAEAEAEAAEVYDRLRARYPTSGDTAAPTR
jgi:hypothetical protein